MTTGEASAHLPRAIPLSGSPSQAGKPVTTPKAPELSLTRLWGAPFAPTSCHSWLILSLDF